MYVLKEAFALNESNIQNGLDTQWRKAVEQDPRLESSDLRWYLTPALWWLSSAQPWRKNGILEGKIDHSFSQPAASTSSIYRIIHPDGTRRILKEAIPNHPFFYTDTTVVQALTLAGEQAIGQLQFSEKNRDFRDSSSIYRGIYIMEENGDAINLIPYNDGENGRVVALMEEVDRDRTLGLLLFSTDCPSSGEMEVIFRELVDRTMSISLSTPDKIRSQARSVTAVKSRINTHTPGKMSRGEIGAEYLHLKILGREYVTLANRLIYEDLEMFGYLLAEDCLRRGGDVRAINTILSEDNGVSVVLDQINLLLRYDEWGTGQVQFAPWGINSATYEVAFLIPDLLASGHEDTIPSIVNTFGKHVPDFADVDWEDLSSVQVRALRFWTAMKAIEMAGLSTFNAEDTRLQGAERDYLFFVINNYAQIGVRMLSELEEWVARVKSG